MHTIQLRKTVCNLNQYVTYNFGIGDYVHSFNATDEGANQDSVTVFTYKSAYTMIDYCVNQLGYRVWIDTRANSEETYYQHYLPALPTQGSHQSFDDVPY